MSNAAREPRALAPSVLAVTRNLPSDRTRHRNGLAVALVLINVTTWIALFLLAILVNDALIKVCLSALVGICTGTMFVVGHDACHGSLTSSSLFNRLAAWLTFLPSLHPPTTWEWGHNRVHHSWTNLATRDDGYPPLSIEQWHALSETQRRLYRCYYTLPGMGFYYMINVWWRSLIWLGRDERAELRTARMYVIELMLLIAFVSAQIVSVSAWGSWQDQSMGWRVAEVALCVVWPFIIWNWVMAFVTLQHHTHPRVRWFDDESEWSYFQSQIGGTVHMKFPRIIEMAFANIFEHTAHHADKRVPLYNLTHSQRVLERQYPGDVIIQRASLRHLRDVLKRCRLYDYRANRWMDFDGRYTT